MSRCILCGRPAKDGSQFCCRDHETLFEFAKAELGRIPLSLSEAEAVFNLAAPTKKSQAGAEQLQLIPNIGR